MSKYRILITIEEDGDELVDYTQTVGWTDDLDAAGDFVQDLKTTVDLLLSTRIWSITDAPNS